MQSRRAEARSKLAMATIAGRCRRSRWFYFDAVIYEYYAKYSYFRCFIMETEWYFFARNGFSKLFKI